MKKQVAIALQLANYGIAIITVSMYLDFIDRTFIPNRMWQVERNVSFGCLTVGTKQ